MDEKDQRKYPRREFKELPWVFTVQLSQPVKLDQSMRFEAKNISVGGIKFIANQKVSLFDELSFLFFDKSSGKELTHISGRVVRLEEVDTGNFEKIYGIAVEFHSDGDSFLREALLP